MQICYWWAVTLPINKGLSYNSYKGIFDPIWRYFFWLDAGIKMEKITFFEWNFLTRIDPEMADPTWPNLSNQKITWPVQDQNFWPE